MMLKMKCESSGACSFGQEVVLKLHFKNLFCDAVTYLCSQSELFERCRGPPRDNYC